MGISNVVAPKSADVDGTPFEQEDVDGVPMEDLDGIPSKGFSYIISNCKTFFPLVDERSGSRFGTAEDGNDCRFYLTSKGRLID